MCSLNAHTRYFDIFSSKLIRQESKSKDEKKIALITPNYELSAVWRCAIMTGISHYAFSGRDH